MALPLRSLEIQIPIDFLGPYIVFYNKMAAGDASSGSGQIGHQLIRWQLGLINIQPGQRSVCFNFNISSHQLEDSLTHVAHRQTGNLKSIGSCLMVRTVRETLHYDFITSQCCTDSRRLVLAFGSSIVTLEYLLAQQTPLSRATCSSLHFYAFLIFHATGHFMEEIQNEQCNSRIPLGISKGA